MRDLKRAILIAADEIIEKLLPRYGEAELIQVSNIIIRELDLDGLNPVTSEEAADFWKVIDD